MVRAARGVVSADRFTPSYQRALPAHLAWSHKLIIGRKGTPPDKTRHVWLPSAIKTPARAVVCLHNQPRLPAACWIVCADIKFSSASPPYLKFPPKSQILIRGRATNLTLAIVLNIKMAITAAQRAGPAPASTEVAPPHRSGSPSPPRSVGEVLRRLLPSPQLNPSSRNPRPDPLSLTKPPPPHPPCFEPLLGSKSLAGATNRPGPQATTIRAGIALRQKP
jgi:hypothetical protein